jgi:hypothetical protein
MSNTINLNDCKPGQKLLSKHGRIFTYVGRVDDRRYPHEVRYPSGVYGTRTDDGLVYARNHMEADEDIVTIIPLDGEKQKEEQSAIIKQMIKDLAKLFPCEWDEALGEMGNTNG